MSSARVVAGIAFLFLAAANLHAAGSSGVAIFASFYDVPQDTVAVTVQPYPGSGPYPTGTVTVRVDNGPTLTQGLQNTVNLSVSATQIVFAPFDPGAHVISISYSGDNNYAPASYITTQTAEVAGLCAGGCTGVEVEGIVFPLAIPVNDSPAVQGTITVSDGGTTVGSGSINGISATIMVGPLSLGNHALTLHYNGSAQVADGVYSILVYPKPVMSVSGATCLLGSQVNLSVSVSDPLNDANGTVIVTSDFSILGNIHVAVNQPGTFTYSCDSVGDHTVRFDFSPIGSLIIPYMVDSVTTTVSVRKPSITLGPDSVTEAPYGGSALRLNFVFANVPASLTGTVSLREGSAAIASQSVTGNSASFSGLGALTVGTHTLTAHFQGSVAVDDVAVAVVITQAQTTTQLSASSTSLTVSIGFASSLGTGTVMVQDGGTTLATRQVTAASLTFPIPALAPGQHVLTATYSGDTNYKGSTSAPVTVTISRPSLSATVPGAPVPYGALATVQIVLNGAPAGVQGSITITESGATVATSVLTGGAASITFGHLTAGTHNFVAHFSGSTPADDASFSVVIAMGQATTLLTAAQVPGTNLVTMVTATVSFSGPSGSGTLTLAEGLVTITSAPLDASGTVIVSVASLAAGTHTLTARYSGDSNYPASSGTLTIQTGPLPTTTRIVSFTPSALRAGQPFDVLVSVIAGVGSPSGNVALSEGSTTLGLAALTANGTATVHIAGLSAGTHVLKVSFQGSTGFAASAADDFPAVVSEAFVILNSASGDTGVSPGSLASMFGTDLVASQATAVTVPLPMDLGGVKLTLVDSAGTMFPVALVFVSPGQINFLVPADAALGVATLNLTSPTGIFTGALTLLARAPAIFAANGAGSGPPAAFLILVHSDGTQESTPVFQCGSAGCTTVSLNLGAPSDIAVLTLYGTGLGKNETVTVHIGTTNLTPDYAGPQMQFPGLDQINVRLPRSLAGSGLVTLSISESGAVSNALQTEF